jgi:putative ABC transport system permease protein
MKQFIISVARNVKKNLMITLINLWGLILGFMCIIFITLWTRNELSYDRFHKNSENIYRVHRYFYNDNGTENLHLPYVAPVIAPLLRNEYPEIQRIARTFPNDMVFTSEDHTKFNENNVSFAEPDILKIFDFEGVPNDSTLLVAPFTMIISDDVATRYFHTTDAIGKKLEFKNDDGKQYAFQVTGVFKSWKGNSHFNPDLVMSFSTLELFFGKDEFTNWGSNNYQTFALIPHLPSDFDKKLDQFIDKYYNQNSKKTKIRLEKLTDIHFNWYSNRSYIYILSSIALLILIIGSINYMNLNAAIYFKRLKEIKIKKILGASQNKLAFLLLTESVLFCFIALIIAVFIASAISGFIKVSDSPLVFKISENTGLIIGFIVLSIFTGVLSGIYPVIILSSYKPVTINTADNIKTRRTFFRNALVVFQFVVSTGLIISFLLVSKQLKFINDMELGLDKENIIVIPATPKLVEKLNVFREQLSQNSNILAVSASKRVPSDGLMDSNGANIISDDKVTQLGFRVANVRVDGQFIPTYKIKILAGRNFNENISADSGYIINESAVQKIGWKSPEDAIGRVIIYGKHKGNVEGVVQDFHYESLHNPVTPIIMYYDPQSFNKVSIRVTPNDRAKTLSFIEKTWTEYNISDTPFSYEYLNDRYNRLYKSEERMRIIFSYFMIVAITIAMLGMIGLSVFLIDHRTKEIGIRKINGSGVSEIMIMLNKNFVKWVVIALAIAVPITFYAMNLWLQNFAYKTSLSWWIFALAGLIAICIALFTVSWQSWKAATRNPVEVLRYD